MLQKNVWFNNKHAPIIIVDINTQVHIIGMIKLIN